MRSHGKQLFALCFTRTKKKNGIAFSASSAQQRPSRTPVSLYLRFCGQIVSRCGVFVCVCVCLLLLSSLPQLKKKKAFK